MVETLVVGKVDDNGAVVETQLAVKLIADELTVDVAWFRLAAGDKKDETDEAGAVVWWLKLITEEVPVAIDIGLKPAADWNKDGIELGAVVCTSELSTGFDG